MKVAVRTDGPGRAWHSRLGEWLVRDGHTLQVLTGDPRSAPAGLGLALAAERRLYGAASSLFEPVPVLPSEAGVADLVLEPRFDGRAGEGALLAALLVGRAPRVDVVDAASGRVLAAGLPAVEQPEILAGGLEMVLARTIQLVARAVGVAGSGAAPQAVSAWVGSARAASPAAFVARTFAGKLARRLRAPGGTPEAWRIAVRQGGDPGAASARAWAKKGFALLPNDGLRFQADPFLFTRGGRTFLFYEDFPYATRKGVILMAELDAAGRPSPPRCVLELPVHLSYPNVFAHGSEIYMLPEMSAASRVQLFRADPFPDRWVPDHVLIDDVVAADATLVEHDGRWWMFATQSGDGGSSWDALALFHAPHLLGPWTPHADNPVLIDAGAARPAGAMWIKDGALMRVAQDCRGGYGVGLAICRVDRLDPDGFAQTVVARLGPPAGLGAECVHTLNRAGVLEVIDVLCPPRRSWRG